MDCFDNFDPIEGNVPLYPFYGLFDVAWKARELLAGLSKQDNKWIEHEVDWQIEKARDLFAEAAERNQNRLDDDSDDFDEEISEIEAMSFAVDAGLGTTNSDEPGHCPIRCAAVLALMFVANCINTLNCPEEDLGTADEGPIGARLIPAANDAFNAALALGLALKYERHIEITNDLEIEMDERLADFNKDRARRAAMRKHGPTNQAKAFVTAEWARHRSAYNGNKSAFARDYVRRIHNEYHVSITEKQMREVWLKDTPPASKPDGLPADGE